MTSFTRLTRWGDSATLTATDLNAEFDAIAEVLNGGLDLENFADGEVSPAFMVNAGDPRFQTGGLDNAELVAAAVAAAVAGDIKVVFVPKTMFGYAGDAGFSGAIFSTNIGMIREGGFFAGHDPVAYGAMPGDPLIDDAPAIKAAHASAGPTNPLGGTVVYTMPGEYTIDSPILGDFPKALFVANAESHFLDGPATDTLVEGGVTFAGSNVSDIIYGLTRDVAPILRRFLVDTTQAVAGSSTQAIVKEIVDDLPVEYVPQLVMARVANSGNPYTEHWTTRGATVLHGGSFFTISVTDVFSQAGSTSGRKWSIAGEILNGDANPQTAAYQVFVIFERIRRIVEGL